MLSAEPRWPASRSRVSSEHMTDHTVKAFDADLIDLMQMISKMGELVESELRDAVEALIRRDTKLADDVIVRDQPNDALHREIEAKAVLLIARRQPVAYDLRLVVAVWETAIELRRVGALAKNIANSVVALGGGHEMSE